MTYTGNGENYDGTTITPVTQPQQQMEQAAHDVAADALEKLGPPQ